MMRTGRLGQAGWDCAKAGMAMAEAMAARRVNRMGMSSSLFAMGFGPGVSLPIGPSPAGRVKPIMMPIDGAAARASNLRQQQPGHVSAGIFKGVPA
jgi:hypothetical protein